MIEVTNLTKRYSNTKALDNVSFRAKQGTITGLIGPNGAGKTTLIKTLVGLTTPDSGQVLINNQPYSHYYPNPIQTIGCLLDGAGPLPERRAIDHLKWIALSNEIPSGRILEVLEEVGLSHAARQKVGDYSLGMKQRLGIAVAILGEPDILILDEPMNGIDPEGMRWIKQLLTNGAQQGKTILVSSHFMKELEDVADHIVFINKGQLVLADTLQNVMQNHGGLESAYFKETNGS